MRFSVPNAMACAPHRSSLEFTSESLGSAVGKYLRNEGFSGYEPQTLSAAAALVEEYGISSFADVGANIGIYSLLLKAIFGERLRVDAYEPFPALKGIACELAALNDLPIQVMDAALSSKDGSATFYVSAKSDSSNSLNPDFRTAKATLSVETRTLDSLYLHSATPPGLIKIDTESTEPDVVEGGLSLLEATRPWIICEVLHGRVERRLTDLLEPLGYSFYHLTGAPLSAPRPLLGDDTYQHRDWLLAPEPPSDLFNEKYARWEAAFALARR